MVPVVELSGKCTLQIKTSETGRCKIEIPRKDNQGVNGADGLINEVLHFAVMRHGKKKFRQMVEEKLAKYEPEWDDHGILPSKDTK